MEVLSSSLKELANKVGTYDQQSIELYLIRGDFELCAQSLGDERLCESLRSLKESGFKGAELRRNLYETIKARCMEIKRNIQYQPTHDIDRSIEQYLTFDHRESNEDIWRNARSNERT